MRWLRACFVGSCALSLAALGCVLGPDESPGCHDDSECEDGFTCHAGACFRNTTDASAPADSGADASDGG